MADEPKIIRLPYMGDKASERVTGFVPILVFRVLDSTITDNPSAAPFNLNRQLSATIRDNDSGEEAKLTYAFSTAGLGGEEHEEGLKEVFAIGNEVTTAASIINGSLHQADHASQGFRVISSLDLSNKGYIKFCL